jgi:hypothetical protein
MTYQGRFSACFVPKGDCLSNIRFALKFWLNMKITLDNNKGVPFLLILKILSIHVVFFPTQNFIES